MLVCNDLSLSRDKIRHALEWGIPAVKANWLWDCLRCGQRKSFDSYLIQPKTRLKRGIIESKKPSNSASETVVNQRQDLGTDAGKTTQAKKTSVDTRQSPQRYHLETEQVPSHVLLETAQSDGANPEVKEVNSPGDSFQLLNAINPETSNPSNESLNPGGIVAAVFQGSDPKGIPLQEISTNSPPKPHHNSEQVIKPNLSLEHEAQNESLTTAISSLLAHHQRDPSRPPRNKMAEASRLGRRKRQLFGRAPSNLSACSNGTASLSRASSVDTMNTDGLGTPLETTHSAAAPAETNDVMAASLLVNFDEDEIEKAEEKPPSTQLGYEDPEAGAWRERLMNRMANGKPGTSGKITTPKARSIGTVKDTVEMGLQSVSRRTRQAGAR